jgi:hypothetical protein
MILLSLLTIAFAAPELRWEPLSDQKLQTGIGLITPSLNVEIASGASYIFPDLVFKSDTASSTNLILGIKQNVFSFAVNNSSGDGKYVKTKNFDFIFRSFGANYAVDAYYQSYRGFYLENAANLLGQNYALPNMEMERIGGMYTYVFNPERFSLDAAFGNSHIQRQSGGSFLLNLQLDYLTLNNSDPLVPTSLAYGYGEAGRVNEIESHMITVGGGYAYSLVFLRDFYVSMALLVGTGYKTIDYGFNEDGSNATSMNVRFATGYNSGNFRLAVTAHQYSNIMKLKDETELEAQTYEVGITLIYRWDDKKLVDRIYSLAKD